MEKKEEKGIITRIQDWLNGLTVRGLLSAILVAFIIIIILLSASYLPSIMSRISSSFSAALYSVFIPAENATVTADKKIINSGEDFTVSFKKGDKASDGLFTISYACDLNIDLLSVESAGLKKIDCDTPFYVLNNNQSLKIRALTPDEVVRLVIEGAFENNTNQKIDKVGVVRVTVKNDTAGIVTESTSSPTSNTSSSVNTPTYNTSANTYAYNTQADLAVRILQVGLMNNGSNLITNQSQFSYQDMIGIRFEVRNDGTAPTGPWSFTAVLPSNSTPTYNSTTQISLRPGESIVFTLGFSNLSNQRTGTININVDPQNIVSESVEYNNLASQTITNISSGDSRYYNNNNNYYYPNYNYNTYNNQGCYVDGYFTYNCLGNNNYNYNNNWNYYNYSDLQVSCHAKPNNPSEDERVRWYVDVYGGEGDYDYDWTGTNGLDSSSENPSKTYTSSGYKYATVTVTDEDDNEATATCSVYVD